MLYGYFLKGITDEFLLALHLSESQITEVLDCLMGSSNEEIRKTAENLSKEWIVYEGRN